MSGARAISHEESSGLLAQLDLARNRVMVLTGFHLGLRAKEVLSLRVKQVADGMTPRAAVTIPRRNLKGGKSGHRSVHGRTIPVHPDLASELAIYLANAFPGGPKPDDFLFPSRQGINQPLSYVQAWRIFKNAGSAAGLDCSRVSTHSMRKSFANEVFESSGHNLAVTQKALGHSSILTTIAYLDTAQDEVDSVVRGMASRSRPIVPPPTLAGAIQRASPESGQRSDFPQ